MHRNPFARVVLFVASILTVGVFATALAQSPAAGPAKPAASRPEPALVGVSAAGRKFMADAAMGGMAEVEAGQLAATKATREEVKAFGERMVKDHGMANEELKRIASAKGVELPVQLDRKHRSELERLSKLDGAEFDRAYMKHMVEDHKKDVAAFRKAARGLKDAEVKQFASSTLPTLEDHLRVAESVAGAAKATSATR